ncbi:serine/threonine kinase [Calothrix parasitica NIES-267]|uniref:non-specific serine/threonine protein kinase n=1 Tax=Calothrix parasitica NIES-267 TaxID=1973488 RepID=A0A1Z4LTS3_9CYAN|nr:serine/threonine kinase [Calothrix parasitica NIES-267]
MSQLLNNRYKIIRIIGQGGFGETFLAEDTYMPSAARCVIKQLKPVVDNPQIYQLIRERFQREAAILEELGKASSQIPSLFAYFTEAGEFYLVQEFIEGITLTDLLMQSGLQSESSVKEILVSLLPILSYVHSKGIIHRDIKPDNIILRSSDKQPVLIDFGAVRETVATMVNSQGNTTSSIVIGTPGFMPSEQAAGRPTFSSDLYALGLTAIYLLTGKIPQHLETDSLTGEIIWRQYAPSISPSLAAVLEKAINSHQRDRFPTAEAMLKAIQTDAALIPPTIPSPPRPISPTLVTDTNDSFRKSTIPASDGSQKGIIIGGTIAGGLIGASILAGFIISSNSSKEVEQTAAVPEVVESSPAQTVESVPNISATPKAENIQPQPVTTPALSQPTPQIKTQQAIQSSQPVTQNQTQPQDYYFIADSAFADIGSASKEVSRLQARGYNGAGMFWIKDYPNLSNKSLYQVYPAKFPNRSSCRNFLQNYARIKSQAYCVFGSSNRNASPDRFYAN